MGLGGAILALTCHEKLFNVTSYVIKKLISNLKIFWIQN